jgi:hypothetical protein
LFVLFTFFVFWVEFQRYRGGDCWVVMVVVSVVVAAV